MIKHFQVRRQVDESARNLIDTAMPRNRCLWDRVLELFEKLFHKSKNHSRTSIQRVARVAGPTSEGGSPLRRLIS
jgi:hypothetical protein